MLTQPNPLDEVQPADLAHMIRQPHFIAVAPPVCLKVRMAGQPLRVHHLADRRRRSSATTPVGGPSTNFDTCPSHFWQKQERLLWCCRRTVGTLSVYTRPGVEAVAQLTANQFDILG